MPVLADLQNLKQNFFSVAFVKCGGDVPFVKFGSDDEMEGE